ncbi:hypothetical protein JTF04_02550 [Mammaliicoccus vitulinus]|uniref:hypothetical protein n=1 Tax=Mammaliicoccus vitulinus TaxID=71237 RepID=UPI00195039F0|nr:hypothetical protein [Mammaliicoccus vitulinus]MBM6628548.1 hypothetical protein [Mammaliicoccus vitulinus]
MEIQYQGYELKGTPEEIKEFLILLKQPQQQGYKNISSKVTEPKILLCNKK